MRFSMFRGTEWVQVGSEGALDRAYYGGIERGELNLAALSK